MAYPATILACSAAVERAAAETAAGKESAAADGAHAGDAAKGHAEEGTVAYLVRSGEGSTWNRVPFEWHTGGMRE